MVKDRMPKLNRVRKPDYYRSWKGTRLFFMILFVFSLTQIAFVITWFYHGPKREGSTMSPRRTSIFDRERLNNPQRKLNLFTEFKGTSDELSAKLNNAYGGEMSVEYSNDRGENEETIEFTYPKPSFPKEIDFSKLKSNNHDSSKSRGYVLVYGRYWEQMTMNLRSLIALAGQAKIGGRKVVEPRVKDSVFSTSGESLGIYYYTEYFNKILDASNYATLVKHREYMNECSLDGSHHVNIHFLYPQKGIDFSKKQLKLNDDEYVAITTKASKTGWIECPQLKNFITSHPKAKQFCVDPVKYTDWMKLEKDVIGGAKCVTISTWRGIGGRYRTYFTENAFKIKSRDIQFALKEPTNILNEAKRFEENKIGGEFIAVQVRAERVVIPHNLNRLRRCLNLLVEIVNSLKLLTGIEHVLVASDMSTFGSGSWRNSLHGEVYNEHTLPDLHNFLTSSTRGIEYQPTNDKVDRGIVALTEMTVISHARYLITIGSGSFQEWVKAKFLQQHRHDKKTWSLITMCSK